MINKKDLRNCLLSMNIKDIQEFKTFIELLVNERKSLLKQLSSIDDYNSFRYIQGKISVLDLILEPFDE